MKLQVQTALAALVLGMCSTAVLADDADKGGGGGSPMPEGCSELCKSAAIPIQLTVPKICHLDASKSIVLNGATGTGSGNFSVGANAGFTVLVNTDNHTSGNNSKVVNGSDSIKTLVTTTGPDTLNLGIPKAKGATMGSFLNYTVNVAATEAYGINKPAGTYTDTYRIQVFF